MPDSDAKIEIIIADNKMKASANYFPAQGSGKDICLEDVLSKIESLGVNTGINHENIEVMCESYTPKINVIIANAIPPQLGEKARIVTYFDVNERRKAIEKENGSVDFHDLGEISATTKGQELYRKVPPTIGSSGKDVLGNELPGFPGNDLKIVLGRGTEFDKDDSNLIRASYDGEIIVSKGAVQISEVHKIDGDVDYSTGNIKFNGSVKIKGTVKSGFKVEAEGDIEINGNVEDAEVIGGNDIIILGGFIGSGEGFVHSKRDVIIKFVENQRIEADRDIVINGPAYHSNLSAGRAIISQGRKSVIVGGQSEAKISIKAKRFGSDAGASTVIKVGVDPKLAERLKNVEESIQKTKESGEKLEKSVVFLYRQKIDKKGKFPPEKQALLEKLEKIKKTIPDKLKILEEAMQNILAEQKEVGKASVTADIAVFPKVIICIGQQSMLVGSKLEPSIFQMFKGEVIRLSK